MDKGLGTVGVAGTARQTGAGGRAAIGRDLRARAYDQARRHSARVRFYKRAIPIGRPQADHYSGELPYTPDERQVVLYAPTWEGDRPSASYGSVASHGVVVPSLGLKTTRDS